MCAQPPPGEFGEEAAESPATTNGSTATPSKRWRSRTYRKADDATPLKPVPPSTGTRTAPNGADGKMAIYGIGRNYNRELGRGAYRTGAAIRLSTNAAQTIKTIWHNFQEAAQDPRATLRLMVQGDQFWFSDASAVELFELMVVTGDSTTPRNERLTARYDEVEPVGVCVVEEVRPASGEDPGESMATWVFRHDVIDGWRCLRYLCRLVLGTSDLTLDRLQKRHTDSVSTASRYAKMCQLAMSIAAPIAYAPAALYRISRVLRYNNKEGVRRKFYAHVVCNLKTIKEIGVRRELGGMTSTLSAIILEAYWAADPNVKHCNVSSNVLFDATRPHGNHMCLRISCMSRKGSTPQKTAKSLNCSCQKVADTLMNAITRRYTLGTLPEWKPMHSHIEKQQKGIDFLVSSLPAFDRCTPTVLDLTVVREFTDWNPSIVYALGIGDRLFLDFYWEVHTSFSDGVFLKHIEESMQALNCSTEMPPSY